MTSFSAEAVAAMRLIASIIEEAIAAAGPTGAPAGVIYAGLMPAGCTLRQFNSIMAGMERAGRVRREGDLYFRA